jgi:hypothetical protein
MLGPAEAMHAYRFVVVIRLICGWISRLKFSCEHPKLCFRNMPIQQASLPYATMIGYVLGHDLVTIGLSPHIVA